MRITTCLSKQAYTAPSIERILLGHPISILKTSSLYLTKEEIDFLLEIAELEDYGEL